jgi:predicted AAA+ superfamily ATPase
LPFILAEALGLPNATGKSALTLHDRPRATRAQLMRHLLNGGMPGAFHIRDDANREIYFNEWIERVILRDLMMFPRIKINPELARSILSLIATSAAPSIGEIARTLRVDTRRVRTHVEALEALFVLHRLEPHAMGSGQPLYFLCDVGLASFLGADFERQLQTWVLQELLACSQWRTDVHERIYYYRTTKGRLVHFLLETKKSLTAIKILAKETVTELDIKILQALKTKISDKELSLHVLGPTSRTFRAPTIHMHPWEALV